MKRNHAKQLLFFLLLFIGQTVIGQQVYEVLVDSTKDYSDLTSGLGKPIKFIAYQNRLIVLDYDSYRILFYRRGTTFDDNKLLKIVGQHSRVQDNQPFHPVNYNRLSKEFTGTIFEGTLWITNYSYGEILLFDLDGNYLLTLAGKYRILDSDDDRLFAFEGNSVYQFDAVQDSFIYLKDLPEGVKVDADKYGTNVKIGYNRLCVKNRDSLHVYNFNNFLNNNQAGRLFSKTSSGMPDFEILPDKIVWSTDYDGNYQYCDLDGNNIGSGNYGLYTYTFNFTADTLYVTGSSKLKMFDQDLNELVSAIRKPFYLSLKFKGADSTNIYFYDHRDGGFAITPLDENNKIYYYQSENEIPYSSWHHEFRISGKYKYILSEWPPKSYSIYRFDTEKMESFHFNIKKTNSFDVLDDSIFTISGKNLIVYSTDGSLLGEHTLSNLTESNLEDIDSTSALFISVNGINLFIGYNDTLNVFNHQGLFIKAYPFIMGSTLQLFSSDTYVFCTSPLNALNISSGKISAFAPESTPQRGFIYKNLYWYNAGTNKYGYVVPTITDIANDHFTPPARFTLYQNYPNPFNPNTKIKFALEKSSRVTIEVFNVLGQRVATLLDKKMVAGLHSVNFNGNKLASGIYFYSITAGSFYQVKKMVLLR